MAAFDRWGGSWGTSWGTSWTKAVSTIVAAFGPAILSVRSGDASLTLSSGNTSRAPHAEPGTLIIRSNPGSEKA